MKKKPEGSLSGVENRAIQSDGGFTGVHCMKFAGLVCVF
jgi:hypothetical protein